MPLLWRIFAVNVLVIVAGAVALVATPATVSHPVAETEAVVVAAGIAALLMLNLLLVRRVLTPLGRLTRFVDGVEPLAPGARADLMHADREVQALGTAINAMLDRLEGERRESALRALAAQEGERRRVARELHDEVGQTLTAAMLALQRAERRAPAEVASVLTEAREDVRASLDEVRAIATRLRPEVLDDLGLASALAALAADLERSAEATVDLTVERNLGSVPPEVELAIYRVAQEALTNAARHAHATRISLRLVREPGEVVLRVGDDGQGLDGAEEGAGIRGMRERAVLAGGRLGIGDRDGVEIELRVPRP